MKIKVSAAVKKNVMSSSLYVTFVCNDGVFVFSFDCCIRCGPDEELILDVVPRRDGAQNSG